MITGAQIKAGRGLLNWTQDYLAHKTGLAVLTIKNVERGNNNPRSRTIAGIEAAFNQAGVIFLDPGVNRDGGAGVRLRA